MLSEIDFMHSTKESENKDIECIFCNGKFSQDERGEIWVKCFCDSLLAHLDCTPAEKAEYIGDFHKQNQSRNFFA